MLWAVQYSSISSKICIKPFHTTCVISLTDESCGERNGEKKHKVSSVSTASNVSILIWYLNNRPLTKFSLIYEELELMTKKSEKIASRFIDFARKSYFTVAMGGFKQNSHWCLFVFHLIDTVRVAFAMQIPTQFIIALLLVAVIVYVGKRCNRSNK